MGWWGRSREREEAGEPKMDINRCRNTGCHITVTVTVTATVSRGDLVAVIVDDYVLSLADGPTFFLFRGSFFVDAPEFPVLALIES